MKKILNILVLLLFIFSLASCNTTNDNDDKNNDGDETKTEIDELINAIDKLKTTDHSCEETLTYTQSVPNTDLALTITVDNNYQKTVDKAYLQATTFDVTTEYYFEILDSTYYTYQKDADKWVNQMDVTLYDMVTDITDMGFSYTLDIITKEENNWIGNKDAISAKLRREISEQEGISLQDISVSVEEFIITLENELVKSYNISYSVTLHYGESVQNTIFSAQGLFNYDEVEITTPDGLVTVDDISPLLNAYKHLYEMGFYAEEYISYYYEQEGGEYGKISENNRKTSIWFYDNKQLEESFTTPDWQIDFYTEYILYGDTIKAYSTTDRGYAYNNYSYNKTRAYYRENMYCPFELKNGYFILSGSYYFGQTEIIQSLFKDSIISKLKENGINATKANTRIIVDRFEIELSDDLSYVVSIRFKYTATTIESCTHKVTVDHQFNVITTGEPSIIWPTV